MAYNGSFIVDNNKSGNAVYQSYQVYLYNISGITFENTDYVCENIYMHLSGSAKSTGQVNSYSSFVLYNDDTSTKLIEKFVSNSAYVSNSYNITIKTTNSTYIKIVPSSSVVQVNTNTIGTVNTNLSINNGQYYFKCRTSQSGYYGSVELVCNLSLPDGVEVIYNSDTIKTQATNGSFTLSCANKKMASDVVIASKGLSSIIVTYGGRTIVSGSGTHTYTLSCDGKKMSTNIVVTIAMPPLANPSVNLTNDVITLTDNDGDATGFKAYFDNTYEETITK